MRHFLTSLVPALGVAMLLAACGSSSSASSSSAPGPSSPQSSSALVKTAPNSKLGTILVDAKGMTLYHLGGERTGKLICTSATCLRFWHPLTAPSSAVSGSGVGSLGTVKRPNGVTQVTYKGMPLYTFAQDQAPGQVHGQGFKDVGTWTAATTGASRSSSSSSGGATQTTPAPSSRGGGGYAY
jgi:predicted lipoprotein with Yx(FWY)xxD motif